MSVHKDEKTGTWYFKKRVINLDGSKKNTTRRGFRTKQEARKAEMELNPYEFKTLTFNQLCDSYLKYKSTKLKESTIYGHRGIIDKYMRDYFKNVDVKNIQNQYVLSWIELLRTQDIGVGRINKVIGVLDSVLKHGEAFYGINANPCRKIEKLRDLSVKKIEMTIWTPEQFKKFISKCENFTYFTFFNLLYYTGLRKGEARALTWGDIKNDKEHKLIVNKTMGRRCYDTKSNEYKATNPKTESGNRIVVLSDKIYDILMKYKDYMIAMYQVVNDNHLIFGYDKPLSETSIARYADKICELANLEKIKIHDFRHSHASLLINMGLNPLFIAERLGHENVSTTLDTYSHLFPTNQTEIAQKIDKLIDEYL